VCRISVGCAEKPIAMPKVTDSQQKTGSRAFFSVAQEAFGQKKLLLPTCEDNGCAVPNGAFYSAQHFD
jgi:hypothetical protein